MLQLFRAISAVLLLLVIALVSALVTMRLAIHGAEVRVPTLTGLTISQTVARLHSVGLEVGIDGHFYSTAQPAGAVLTQSPAPGTHVRKSWRVRVTESLGAQKVAVPALSGMDQTVATITIRHTGLQVGDVVGLAYAYAPENTVIAQTPLAHATDVQGPRVSLLTAQPPVPVEDASIMPDLVGETFTTAAFTIIHAGFKLAPLQNPAVNLLGTAPAASTPPAPVQPSALTAPAAPTSPQEYVPSGTVIGQVPLAGSRIVDGSSIQLTVQP